MDRTIRSRKWFGTIWSEQDIEYIKRLKYQYLLISALDQTSEQHEGRQQDHWHVFIQFSSNRTRPKTQNAHWEIPRHITAAINYCKAKGQPSYEKGDLGICKHDKVDWENFVQIAKQKPKEQLIDTAFSKYVAQYPRFADMVYSVANPVKVIQGELKHLWIYGEAGCGKTSWVWDQVGEQNLYVKNANKWWDNYKGEKVVLIDDWDPDHCKLVHHLKQWADRYPILGEMKGAGRKLRPEQIIITSNYKIDDCFERPEDRAAIHRRFKEIYGRPTCSILEILGNPSNTGEGTTEYPLQTDNGNIDEEEQFFLMMMEH